MASNVYDNVINGSFSQLSPSVAEMYAGIYPPASSAPIRPGWTPATPPNVSLNASPRLPSGYAGIDPVGWTPPTPATAYAPQPATLPAVTAATAPGSVPVTSVTGAFRPGNGPGYQVGDGLLSLLTGGRNEGLGGLFNMLGGGTAAAGGGGGLLGLLFGQQNSPAAPSPVFRNSRMTDANGNNQSLTSGSQSNVGLTREQKQALAAGAPISFHG